MEELRNKTALVSGATTGIGLAAAHRPVAGGAHVRRARRQQRCTELVRPDVGRRAERAADPDAGLFLAPEQFNFVTGSELFVDGDWPDSDAAATALDTVSRQAAFQRCGRPADPRTGEPLSTTPLTDAAELAATVIDDLASGRWSKVTDQFDPTMRDGLSEDALAAAWTQVVGLSGAYEKHGEPAAVRAGDMTITSTTLSMEAGDCTARITFRDDRTIAGLHILDDKTS